MKEIGVLAFFALLCSVQAQYNDARCEASGGRCQYTSQACRDGSYVRGLCGGPSNRRCCISQGGGSYDDSACSDRGGTCQTSSSCSGGQYVKGLCGGPSNRRCCMKTDAPCTSQQRQLACGLLKNGNVRAATSHPSGVKDNAYARNNLQDMCSGGKASRSSYRCNAQCHAPGGSTCLSLNVLKYLMKLTESGIVQINELAGACHSCKSRHYSGLAVDLHKASSRKATYKAQCKQFRGLPIEERNHIHCQFYDAPHPNFSN